MNSEQILDNNQQWINNFLHFQKIFQLIEKKFIKEIS